MSVHAHLLNGEGWKTIESELSYGQINSEITQNLLRHLNELNAQSVLIDDEYLDRDFTEAFSAYYSRLFKRHTKLCKRLHFFKCDLSDIIGEESPSELAQKLEVKQNDYLGFIILRPIHEAPIAQVSLKTPSVPEGHEAYSLVKAEYYSHVLGAEFVISTLPMTQQDQRIGACAQATIWSSLRHFHTRHKGQWVSTVGITEAALKQESANVSRTLPNGSEFLSLNGMVSALRIADRKPLMYVKDFENGWGVIRPVDVINRYIDSGIPVIIGLDTGGQMGHAVVVSGQVFKTTPLEASELVEKPTRAAFCSAYYVNDDQLGCNLRMPVDGNVSIGETLYNLEDGVQFLLIPLPDKVFLPGEKAELFAWDLLYTYRDNWNDIIKKSDKDLGNTSVISECFLENLTKNTVLARTYLTYGWKHKHRLLRNTANHEVQQIARDLELPKYVWVTEFGTLDSFSISEPSKRTIYAHCVVDATAKNMGEDCRLLFHAPGFVLTRKHDDKKPDGSYRQDLTLINNDKIYCPKRRGQMGQ